MARTSDAASPSPGSRVRSHGGSTAAAIGAIDLVLVALLLLLDRVQVESQEGLTRVRLGRPLSWVTQDQGIDPPLPARARLLSPWEHPTTAAWLPLVVDLAIVGLLLTGAWVAARAVRGRRTPGSG